MSSLKILKDSSTGLEVTHENDSNAYFFKKDFVTASWQFEMCLLMFSELNFLTKMSLSVNEYIEI